MEEATEEGVAVDVAEDMCTVHKISHMMEVSSMSSSSGVLWVLAVALVEDIGVTVVVVVVVMGVEIIAVIVEIIGNMVVDMIVKMVNGDQVQKSMIIGVKTVEVAVDLLLSKALDTIIIMIMNTNADNTDHVDT